MSKTYNASDLHALISGKYSTDNGWAVVHELAFQSWGGSRVDAFAVQTWKSKGPHYVAFEVKASRADFRRELDNPGKREEAEKMATEFYFVAPRGVIPVEEIPDGAGLLETWGENGLRATRRARQHKDRGPSVEFWTRLLRRVLEQTGQEREKFAEFAEFAGKTVSAADLRRLANKIPGHYDDSELWTAREKAGEMRAEAKKRHDAFWGPRESVVTEAQRLAEEWLGERMPTDHAKPRGYYGDRDPEAVAAALRQIRNVAKIRRGNDELAKKLREAADALDPPAAKGGEDAA